MDIKRSLELLAGSECRFPTSYAGPGTRGRIASALVDALWRHGRFRLGNLSLQLRWGLPECGDEAYETAVEAAADYIDGLGIGSEFIILEETSEMSLDVRAVLDAESQDGDMFADGSFRSARPLMEEASLSGILVPDPRSWLVYIPFDTSSYSLGGSHFAAVSGLEGEAAPRVSDPDYFMDCFEVIREFVEDGILLSGATVGTGGIAAAMGRMISGGTGIRADLSDLAAASGEYDAEHLVFSEVPGALVQIRDSDFDYVDAELLLQDIAYYPLGHPSDSSPELDVVVSGRTGIQRILDSLINYC